VKRVGKNPERSDREKRENFPTATGEKKKTLATCHGRKRKARNKGEGQMWKMEGVNQERRAGTMGGMLPGYGR